MTGMTLREMMDSYRKDAVEGVAADQMGGSFCPEVVDGVLKDLFDKLHGTSAHQKLQLQAIFAEQLR